MEINKGQDEQRRVFNPIILGIEVNKGQYVQYKAFNSSI